MKQYDWKAAVLDIKVGGLYFQEEFIQVSIWPEVLVPVFVSSIDIV